MSEKEKDWREEMREILKPVEERLGKLSSMLEHPATLSKEGESETMPMYKCSGKDCKFSTEDIEAFIDHKIDERVTHKPAEEAAPPKKRHETVEDYLACPECYPKFENGILKHPKFLEKYEVHEKGKVEEF